MSQPFQPFQRSTIQCSSLSFSYPQSAAPLFSDITFTLSKGWTAVLGDNGIGKTTLMRVVTGDLHPSAGSVAPDPADVVSYYCEQRIDMPPLGIDAFCDDWSPETLSIRRLLGIGDDWPYRYGTLSGGEAKRLQIACALSGRPDLLVLDEPTNHVDEPTRHAIVTALRGYRGIGVIVSHDPGLIDAVCGQCLWLRRRHIGGVNVTVAETYPGNYTYSAERIRNADSHDDREMERARADRMRLSAARDQRFRAVQHAEAIKRKAGFRIDPHDHDALDRRKGAKATSVDGHSTRSYAGMEGRLNRARRRVETMSTAAQRYDGDIWFLNSVSGHGELMRLEPGTIMFGEDHAGTGDANPDARALSAAGAAAVNATTGTDTSTDTGTDTDTDTDTGTDTRTDTRTDTGTDTGTGDDRPDDCGEYARLIIDGQRSEERRHDGQPGDGQGGAGDGRGGDATTPPGGVNGDGVNGADGRHPIGLRTPMLSVGPHDHIGVSGPNGLGKTTLINRLLQSAADVPKLVIDQTLPPDSGGRTLARLRGLRPESRSRVMNAYAQLNSDPDRLLDGQGNGEPSPGELRKLLLCLGIVDEPQLIVMDEPTNHLDLGSKKALAAALRDFTGAVILVSHEGWFLDAATDIRWTIDRP